MSDTSASLLEMRIFVAVYEEGSFTAAAVREHATQSGVSQHIRNVEERLGTELFIRQNRVVPTPAGTSYYWRCIEVLRIAVNASAAMADFGYGLTGEASGGLVPEMTHSLLAKAYPRFNEQHPNASVRVVEGYNNVLVERVLSEELDFAVLSGAPPSTPGLRSVAFLRVPLFLMSAKDSGLHEGHAVDLASLVDLKLILAPSGTDPSPLDEYLRRQAIRPRELRINSVFGVFDLVRRSDWKAIVSGLLLTNELVQPTADRLYTINPLSDTAPFLDLVLVSLMSKPLSSVAEAFLEMLREIGEAQNELTPSSAWENTQAGETGRLRRR